MLFIEYPKCSTCQKAKKWLDEHEITYTDRHIVEQNPSYEELKEWHEKSGLPLKKFFNTSGLLYKEMKLKDRLPEMSNRCPPIYSCQNFFFRYLVLSFRQADYQPSRMQPEN